MGYGVGYSRIYEDFTPKCSHSMSSSSLLILNLLIISLVTPKKALSLNRYLANGRVFSEKFLTLFWIYCSTVFFDRALPNNA